MYVDSSRCPQLSSDQLSAAPNVSTAEQIRTLCRFPEIKSITLFSILLREMCRQRHVVFVVSARVFRYAVFQSCCSMFLTSPTNITSYRRKRARTQLLFVNLCMPSHCSPRPQQAHSRRIDIMKQHPRPLVQPSAPPLGHQLLPAPVFPAQGMTMQCVSRTCRHKRFKIHNAT